MKIEQNGHSATGVLRWQDAPAHLSRFVLGFVYRDDRPTHALVRILPELRPSLQFMRADDYWLKERASDSLWRKAPRAALWGPRGDWAYGYAARHVEAFAIGLTPLGLRTITHERAHLLEGVVCALSKWDEALADALSPKAGEAFAGWVSRVTAALEARFANVEQDDPTIAAADLFVIAQGDAVAQAAAHLGVSERQFRRVFLEWRAMTPKRYQRALRVDRMLRQLHGAPWEADLHRDWPLTFADQPHAIREFRAMTGMTPHAYWAAKRTGDVTLRSVPAYDVEPPR